MIAVVTGGTGGLGQAICRRLAADGYSVAIGYHRRRAEAETLAASLAGEAVRAVPLGLDVADAEHTQRAIEQVVRDLGGLDAVVNCAAHNVDGLLQDITPTDAALMQGINVLGVIHTVRAALPHLFLSSCARIVNFSSILATRAGPGASVYASTKSAVEGLTRAWAVDFGPKRITVNAVAPGFVNAGLGVKPVLTAGEALRAMVPLRRPGLAEEVASVVAFLLGKDATYVNGTVIPVDGGLAVSGRFVAAARPALQEATPS